MREPPASPAAGRAEQRVVLLVAATASFLTPFMGSSVNIALPTIGREFGADAVTLSWITTAYLLAAAMFLVPFGRLADITGRRRMFLLGIGGYTLMSVLCMLVPSETVLVALRGLQGVTDAMMFGTSLAILTSVFPPGRRGRALGINVAAVYSGGALGPFIGGLLTQAFGWRGIFALTALLGAAATTLALAKMRGEWAEARGQRMDVLGALLYAVSLAAVMYGLRLLPAPAGWALAGAGLAVLALFAWRESLVDHPVLDVGPFRSNAVFAFSNLAALVNYAATFAVSFLLSLFLQYAKGLPPRDAGILLLAQPVTMAIVSPLAGRLADRIEPRVLATSGMALCTAGLVLLSLLGPGSPLAAVAGILVLCGLGFGLFSSPNTSAIMGSVERRYYAVASATTGVMRLVGQMLSMGVAALVLSLAVGDVEITEAQVPAFLRAYRTGLRAFSLVCAAGIAASLARGRLHGEGGARRGGGA